MFYYGRMLRYLPGIIIIQVATAALLLAAVKTSDQELWIAIGCLALVVTVVTAFWFDSIAAHIKKDAVIQAKDDFSREREKLRVNAERAKTRLIKKSHEQINRETNRAHARANFKVGGAFVGVIAAGTLMVFTQFMTLGLLMLATGGGALAGYLARLKQERIGSGERVVKVVAEEPGAQNKLKGPAAD
jgi:cobalamin biosynthesis protein CobD/CbiB